MNSIKQIAPGSLSQIVYVASLSVTGHVAQLSLLPFRLISREMLRRSEPWSRDSVKYIAQKLQGIKRSFNGLFGMPTLLPRFEIWECLLWIGKASTATASTAQSCRKPKITTLQIMYTGHQALRSIVKVHIKPVLSHAIYVQTWRLCHRLPQRVPARSTTLLSGSLATQSQS